VPIVQEFRYVKPKSIAKAINEMASAKNYALLAGGTDLVNMFKENVVEPRVVIDVKGIPQCKGILLKGKKLFIGANTTFTELMESDLIRDHVPIFAEMAGMVASPGIRNRATMIGNICSAVPCMDSGPVLLIYDIHILTVGKKGERSIPIAEWFIAPRKTALKKNEFVKGLSITLPAKKNAGCFTKLGRYRGEDLAQVNLAVLVDESLQYKIAYGSVGPVPIRAQKTETVLNGQRPDEQLMRKAAETALLEIKPIADIRASKEYRELMAQVMLKRAVAAALDRLDGRGVRYGVNVLDM
jgi:carbon-monoxide dehydrogenase medium subunit